VAAWFTKLEPAHPVSNARRPDDRRLGEVIETWDGNPSALTAGRAVIVGFPQDEGVRRNNGRTGAAEAPNQIRQWLYRLTPWDGMSQVSLIGHPPLDIGNIRIQGSLENSQNDLGHVIANVLKTGAVPIVLGGGHETAYGHYLGYVASDVVVGVINIDAHLDVRPCVDGLGHSGSPFRQAMDHPARPLPGSRYSCLGAQPQSVSRAHYDFVHEKGGVVAWCGDLRNSLSENLNVQIERLAALGCQVYVTLDADVVSAADVPGASAPNPAGLPGVEVLAIARVAGASPHVASFDIVEINPRFDFDSRSVRWAALAVWNFLIGVAKRGRSRP
jgi:formiminoglutamase